MVLIRDGTTRALDVDVQVSTSPGAGHPRRHLQRPAGFGLTFEDTPIAGCRVQEVEPGSAADNAGIEPGDILTKVNTRPVRTAAEAEHVLRRLTSGRTAFVVVSRDGAERMRELNAY
jgi:S1-C subfamily serine protease